MKLSSHLNSHVIFLWLVLLCEFYLRLNLQTPVDPVLVSAVVIRLRTHFPPNLSNLRSAGWSRNYPSELP